jgi:hypothetical protein
MRVFIIERNEDIDAYDAVTNEPGSESAPFRRIEACKGNPRLASFTLAGTAVRQSPNRFHAVRVSPQARPAGFRDL